MKLRRLSVSILIGISAISSLGEVVVRGRIIDSITLQPIPGGIVKIEGTTVGTSADANGIFTIRTDTANYISLHSAGYEPQTLKARHQLGNITMRKEIPSGEEEKIPTPEEIKEWIAMGFDLYNQKKYNEAFDLFQKAVLEGSSIGEYASGVCYMNGEGVGKDEFKGAMFVLSAAMSGLTDAQCLMGVIYSKGIGFMPNKIKAKEWFNKAAAKGDERAIKALEEMK